MPRRVTLPLLPLCTALLCGLLGVAAPAGAQGDRGHTGAPDGVLRSGCHGYRYHWVIRPGTNDWLLETFLRGPGGKRLASGMFDSDSEQKRDHSRFRFCRYSTHAGRFTIRARITWYNGSTEHHARLDPSHFRLRRP